MNYRTASFRINGNSRQYSSYSYDSDKIFKNIELKLIKFSVITLSLLLFFISSAILKQINDKKILEISKEKDYQTTLLNQYKSLTEEKSIYFSQKNYNEYTRKLGLHPPRENQIVRIRD